MRELKFRAFINHNVTRYPKDIVYWGVHQNPPRLDNLIRGSTGQFTGLKDKNGKEIYEGDIVRVLYTDWPSKSPDDPRTLAQYQIDISKIGEIVFEGYEWCVKMPSKYGDSYNTFIVGKHGWMEVIGNIHENPGLL